MSDSRLQEIVTRAVVGRAERRVTWGHAVPAEGVTGVLGVHVANTTVAVREEEGRPTIDLIVDCDLWCTCAKTTKVIRCTCRNTEVCDIQAIGQILGERDLRATLTGAARATGVDVQNAKVLLSLEVDVMVEMSALTRLWIKAYDFEQDLLEDLDDTDSSFSLGSESSGSESSGSESIDYSFGE